MIRVLGIDPGGTTGLAVLYFDHSHGYSGLFQQVGDGPLEQVRQAAALMTGRTYRTELVAIESFVVNRRAGRSRTAGAGEAARLIIGGVAQLCREAGVQFVQRPAGVVKPWATDRRLEAAGLIQPTRGLPHARDAARHALYAAVRDLGLPDPLSTKERT